jgi:hypothetical protein
MSSERDSGDVTYRVREAHDRLDDHEQSLDNHDRRISRNENWRLQAQGALKIIAVMLGAGALAYLVDIALALT